MTVTRDDVIREAIGWVGTPSVHQASEKGVGADCVGLVRGVMWNLGLTEVHHSNPRYRELLSYPRQVNSIRMGEALEAYLTRIVIAEARMADVLWFMIRREERHLGIIVRNNYIVHASNKGGRRMTDGRVLYNRIDSNWKIVRAYRMPGVI